MSALGFGYKLHAISIVVPEWVRFSLQDSGASFGPGLPGQRQLRHRSGKNFQLRWRSCMNVCERSGRELRWVGCCAVLKAGMLIASQQFSLHAKPGLKRLNAATELNAGSKGSLSLASMGLVRMRTIDHTHGPSRFVPASCLSNLATVGRPANFVIAYNAKGKTLHACW
jgi:hypothetical protein